MSSTTGAIDWQGYLDDDCTAIWMGLMLRAEEMESNSWWWAVSRDEGRGPEVGASNWDGKPCPSGVIARQRAEACAREFLGISSK